MPAPKVEAQHVGEHAIFRAIVLARRAGDAQPLAGPPAVAAVQQQAAPRHRLLANAMLADVGHQRLELGAFHKREDFRRRVKIDHISHYDLLYAVAGSA